jgi:Capsular polysaccharide biosynthesis protein
MKQQTNNEVTEIDLVEVFWLLWKNIWTLIMCGIIGALVAFSGVKLLVQPMYKATSMIYVLSKSTSLSSYLDIQLGQQLTVDFKTLAESRTVVETVINDLQLDTDYETMTKQITVENPTGTQILKLSSQNSDPALAKEIANAWADATAERIATVMSTSRPNTVDVAVTPKTPYNTNLMKNTLIGGLIGFLIAAAVIIIRDLMDDTITSEEDVTKYLGLTTLASIPVNEKERTKRKHRR